MRKDIRYVAILVVMILLALLCLYRILADKEMEKDGQAQTTGSEAMPTERIIVVPDKDNNKVLLGTISFYTVSLSGRTIESVEVAVGKETKVTPKLVSECVTDALEDEEIDLGIIGIEEKDGVCYINFNDSIRDVANSNPDIEKLILDAYAMSIVDNCDVEGVSFKIEGRSYSTQNIVLNDGEVYLKN